jgi:hypothetical protein
MRQPCVSGNGCVIDNRERYSRGYIQCKSQRTGLMIELEDGNVSVNSLLSVVCDASSVDRLLGVELPWFKCWWYKYLGLVVYARTTQPYWYPSGAGVLLTGIDFFFKGCVYNEQLQNISILHRLVRRQQ